MATCPGCGEIVMEGDPYCSNCGCIFNWDDEEDEHPVGFRPSRARSLKREAWECYEDGCDDDALELIEEAIELDGSNPDFYNVKAIILEDMGDYEEALKYYDISLEKGYSQVVQNNKARALAKIAMDNIYSDDLQYCLVCVNEALKITDDEKDRRTFLKTKSEILERQGKIADSRICHYLSEGMDHAVEKVESQTKAIAESKHAVICITGTQHYTKKLDEGDIVDLIREPENEHDSDAIRIEKDGETAGYVANSQFTLVDGAKSASEIRDLIRPGQKAKVMFLYLDRYLMARLLNS